MEMGLLFWIIMFLCILSYIGSWWNNFVGPWAYSNGIINLVLFGLLGWKVFGPALR